MKEKSKQGKGRLGISRRSIRGIWIALVFLFVPLFSWVVPDATVDRYVEAAGKYKGRIINVVYDDSGSMVRDDDGVMIPRWSQAKYALEVFAAMLGENDVMNIYPMSKEGGLGYTLRGTDKNRVSTVHDMNGDYRNTPFTTVTSAGKALLAESSDYERWLVIITDGAFDDGKTPVSDVQAAVESYISSGIKVAYLAIGENASTLTADPSRGFYTEKAADGIDVLKKVTSIANQIFSHLILPDECISTSGSKIKLSIDIPTDEIIVFAQGEDVKIGDLSTSGKTIKPTEQMNVKYSDLFPTNSYYQGAIADTTLKGVVAKFNAGKEPFADGDFEISVSGAKTIEFYYKPGVVVNANLIYEGSPVMQDQDLFEGSYDVEMNFINPLTNMPVQSKLLAGAVFSLTIDNNGEEFFLDSDKGKDIHLKEGGVELTATAELPGQVVLTDIKNYIVRPQPIALTLEAEKKKGTYTKEEFANGEAAVSLVVTNAETGQRLSEEEWNNTKIQVSEAGGVSWDVKKGDEVSTWLLTSKAEGTESVSDGNLSFTVAADFQIGEQDAHGTGDFSFNATALVNDTMELEVVSVPEYTLYNLEEEPGIVVKAYINKRGTKERVLIDEALWQSMTMTATTDKKMDLKAERGENVGEFIIHPMYYQTDKKGLFSWIPKSHDRKALKTDCGEITINIVGDATGTDRQYHGETSVTAKVKELSFMEKLSVLLPLLIAIAILLFLIIGYLVKKRIPKRKLNPRCFINNDVSSRKKIKKNTLTVLLPYVSEKGLVFCNDTAHQCNFPRLKIKAISNSSFRVLNTTYPLEEVEINDNEYEDIRQFRAAKFQYSTFRISSLDPNRRGRQLGTFVFKFISVD